MASFDRGSDLWHAPTYLTFAAERQRPAEDLLARLTLADPAVVYDLGCGTGNITALLAKRWPGARITGIDSSVEMLTVARSSSSPITWTQANLAEWQPGEAADLLFSNAALHWLDDHERLFPRLLGFLNDRGVLAVQMPRNPDAATIRSLIESVEAGPWQQRLRAVLRSEPVHGPEIYMAMLLPRVSALDVWETVYWQVLTGDNPVLAWTRGTLLRPLLAALNDDEQDAFLADYGARLSRAYPQRADGLTLFPFRRLFIVATR